MPIALTYRVRRGLRNVDVLEQQVRNAVIDRGERAYLGMDLVSDTTVEQDIPLAGTGIAVVRTIVLRPSVARQAEYQVGTSQSGPLQIAVTRKLYLGQLQQCVPAIVTADEPVFT